jgi:hypothetical protein
MPPPVINSDMSQVIDDAASTMNDTHDDASTMIDNTVPLGEFLDERLDKAIEIENAKNAETLKNNDPPIMPSSPTRVESPDEHVFDRETARAILACNNRDEVIKLLAEMKEKSMRERMKYDPKFTTSPIFVTDKDYEFSVNPELITLVESDPFHGYETKTVVAHLTKLNDIATLFAHEEKIRYYYILKLFPFSLTGDAKIWYNTLAPGCVRSPQDMIYYFSEKYFPAHKKQAALQEIFNFVQIEEENRPQAWGRLLQLLNALPDHPLKKNEILDIFYNGLTDASRDYLDSCASCVFRE